MGLLEAVVDKAGEGAQGAPEDVDSPEYVNWVVGHVCRYFHQKQAGEGLQGDDEDIVGILGSAPIRLKNSQLIHILRAMDLVYASAIEENAKALCRGNGSYMACLGQIVSERASNMERIRPELDRALLSASWQDYSV